MPNRKSIPKEIETQVLVKSGRRCCICFGVNGDFTDKKGQIAHLDRDSSNTELANLAFLCLVHHDEYDTRRSQSKGLTIGEVKEYRTRLCEVVAQMRKGVWPIGLDVPLLKVYRRIDSVAGIPTTGFQLTD